jgi:hypothetical protein
MSQICFTFPSFLISLSQNAYRIQNPGQKASGIRVKGQNGSCLKFENPVSEKFTTFIALIKPYVIYK